MVGAQPRNPISLLDAAFDEPVGEGADLVGELRVASLLAFEFDSKSIGLMPSPSVYPCGDIGS